ncbi:MAG: ABC transporter ATP-binding protein, partial [Chloroflexi bacterium]|nr:ABC transporter ATP-binding protein [Chloroflexota bacterium]
QRVMIAMSLACDPALLIADEPTTALDVTIQAQITDLVNRLKDRLGMAIIWITHDLGVVAGLVDRVIVMYAGFIVESAPVFDLYKRTSHPYTLGLLRSMPSIHATMETNRLMPVEGTPPDLYLEPTRCPFAPRCQFAEERCWQANPPLQQVSHNHHSACWRWEDVQAAGAHGR